MSLLVNVANFQKKVSWEILGMESQYIFIGSMVSALGMKIPVFFI